MSAGSPQSIYKRELQKIKKSGASDDSSLAWADAVSVAPNTKSLPNYLARVERHLASREHEMKKVYAGRRDSPDYRFAAGKTPRQISLEHRIAADVTREVLERIGRASVHKKKSLEGGFEVARSVAGVRRGRRAVGARMLGGMESVERALRMDKQKEMRDEATAEKLLMR